jgi:hypothetical protein
VHTYCAWQCTAKKKLLQGQRMVATARSSCRHRYFSYQAGSSPPSIPPCPCIQNWPCEISSNVGIRSPLLCAVQHASTYWTISGVVDLPGQKQPRPSRSRQMGSTLRPCGCQPPGYTLRCPGIPERSDTTASCIYSTHALEPVTAALGTRWVVLRGEVPLAATAPHRY